MAWDFDWMGDLFDFDGDGHVDLTEAVLGQEILEDGFAAMEGSDPEDLEDEDEALFLASEMPADEPKGAPGKAPGPLPALDEETIRAALSTLVIELGGVVEQKEAPAPEKAEQPLVTAPEKAEQPLVTAPAKTEVSPARPAPAPAQEPEKKPLSLCMLIGILIGVISLLFLSLLVDAIKSGSRTLTPAERAELDALWKRQEQQKEAEKRAFGAPYVGMGESSIRSTPLGAPGEVLHNITIKNGERCPCNIYRFYNSAGELVFVARCVGGLVESITDYRAAPKTSYKGNGGGQSSGSSRDPRVEDFTNPEDFYEYYYYDFFDYEQAESYYYDHGGF